MSVDFKNIKDRITKDWKKFCPLVKQLWALSLVRKIVFIAIPIAGIYIYLGYGDDGKPTGGAHFLQNLIIFCGAGFGLYSAWIRSNAMYKQSATAEKQYATAEKRYGSEQFTTAVNLLAKNNQDNKPAIEARINGIYALKKLAEANPQEYGASVMKTLVVYIQNTAQLTALPVTSKQNPKETTTNPQDRAHLGGDVKTAFAALKRLHDDETVLKESGLQGETRDELSFAHTDFQNLCLNEIEWIENPNLNGANLDGADLYKAELKGADLRGAQLNGANLMEAQLNDADLRKAQLNDAYLFSAQLNDANLMGAHLNGANLDKTELNRADLNGAQLNDATLRWAELNRAVLLGAELNRAHLVHAKLTNANLYYAKLNNATLNYANLSGANLYAATIKYTSFWNATVTNLQGLDNCKKLEIWHSNQDIFTKHQPPIESLKEDAEWDLIDLCDGVPDDSDRPISLQSVLENFAEKSNKPPSIIALKCREAMRKLKDSDEEKEKELWNSLPDDWKTWLLSLDDNYKNPEHKQ